MKRLIFILLFGFASLFQNFSTAALQSDFETEVEFFLSDLDSANSDVEKEIIRKKFFQSKFDNIKNSVSKKIKKLESKLSKYAKKLQKEKDSKKSQRLQAKIADLTKKIKELKDFLFGSSSS